ncbi:MAG: Tic22 family protein [Cyanobacteriota bacterium]|nr:Tic22 family protein [Cyanobacteriota bacterium]
MGFVHRLLGATAAALLVWPAAVAPARALPEAEAINKLAVVPVFMLVNAKGVPVPKVLKDDKLLLVYLFMERSRAEAELQKVLQAQPGGDVRVMPIPLNVANERIVAINKVLNDGNRMLGPVVPREADMAAARTILRNLGRTDEEIKEGLAVPVFFTKPYLEVNTPEGPRAVFFLTHADLQKALAGAPANRQLAPQAADISFAIQQIMQTKQDSFVFYPPPDYFRLVQEEQARQKGGAATPPAPPRP